MTEESKKAFPLEKILTVSAGDYCKTSAHQRLFEYQMVGVHVYNVTGIGNLHELFAREVPKNAEAVVDYRTSVALTESAAINAHFKSFIEAASGTALIPKNKSITENSEYDSRE